MIGGFKAEDFGDFLLQAGVEIMPPGADATGQATFYRLQIR
jgi:hypothetical protein